MKKCLRCDIPYIDAVTYCTKCGGVLESVQPPPEWEFQQQYGQSQFQQLGFSQMMSQYQKPEPDKKASTVVLTVISSVLAGIYMLIVLTDYWIYRNTPNGVYSILQMMANIMLPVCAIMVGILFQRAQKSAAGKVLWWIFAVALALMPMAAHVISNFIRFRLY